MGCPDIYYKRALQQFAHTLVLSVNAEEVRNLFNSSRKELADKLFHEESEEVLEETINKLKDKISEREFYFYAGTAYMSVSDDVWQNEGNDALNASIGGLGSFCVFVGIEEDD